MPRLRPTAATQESVRQWKSSTRRKRARLFRHSFAERHGVHSLWIRSAGWQLRPKCSGGANSGLGNQITALPLQSTECDLVSSKKALCGVGCILRTIARRSPLIQCPPERRSLAGWTEAIERCFSRIRGSSSALGQTPTGRRGRSLRL